MMLQSGFFDIVERYRMLTELGDPLRMFKILVLQSLYNPGDDQPEFQIRDRFSLRATLFKKDRLGGQHLSLAVQRRAVEAPRHHQPYSLPKLAWRRAARVATGGQSTPLSHPRPGRIRLRTPDDFEDDRDTQYRTRPRRHQDRVGQPGVQHVPARAA